MNVGLMTPAELALQDVRRELVKLDNAGVPLTDIIATVEGIEATVTSRVTMRRAFLDEDANGPGLFPSGLPSREHAHEARAL